MWLALTNLREEIRTEARVAYNVQSALAFFAKFHRQQLLAGICYTV